MDSFTGSGFGPRKYRDNMGAGRFRAFVLSYKDSDLWIGVDPNSYDASMAQFAYNALIDIRMGLERFIETFPLFKTSLIPVILPDESPEIAKQMNAAASLAGVGPMAAVAGAFAEYIGKLIQGYYPVKEIVVENGGDIYLDIKKDLLLTVYAGNSLLSEKIGLIIPYDSTPVGICTSAGKVGPSLSFGKADAVMVTCKNTALADSFATAFGNMVNTAGDIPIVLEKTKQSNEILSCLIICQNQLGITGQFNLIPIDLKL